MTKVTSTVVTLKLPFLIVTSDSIFLVAIIIDLEISINLIYQGNFIILRSERKPLFVSSKN
jgi:hypothetical protein